MDKQELIKKINELPTYGYDTTIVKRHVIVRHYARYTETGTIDYWTEQIKD